ncbi:xanthine dehydrogenase molybdopterin binding subunit [Pararhizobium mangrovi]|uniref:Xanthine dehydrogenase molybdopterin binding subunit n=1 Tax=Pararhizobium mangrovi TaxID=2590452 RepID=A0A506TZ92_9HYPH|nr:xanthine dehydrogenase molybdopterin binding subunit [Pararhizobium mangrovi]TPW26626.1 xanthine dehydrogenase molybdopterin binding subunit [Pararhizobium mangrovi]
MDKRNDDLPLKEAIEGGTHTPRQHDSAHKHVAGTADYTDDMMEPIGTLHACLGLSTIACGRILSVDLDPVRTAPGVVGVLTADDVPGLNDVSPTGKGDEPIFPRDRVDFHGQPLFAVVAETRGAARKAAKLAKIDYAEETPVIDVLDAGEDPRLVTDGMTLSRGDSEAAIEGAANRLSGTMRIGGQDHFYLEGQIAFAIPGEDRDMTVWSSTQHPSEVQHMVAQALDVPSNAVTIQVRRMGGAFGGKETQGNLFAVVTAIAARRFRRAVKIRPDRDDDMIATGKRHDFLCDYEVGFDETGRIEGVDFTYVARCGYSADLSGPVTDRALFHCDNAYYYPAVTAVSAPLFTNTVSNTAFRGFGGPQGLVGGERVIEEIAYALGKDTLEVRRANFYGETGSGRDVTPYYQTVEDNILDRITDELEASSDYQARRAEIVEFNRTSRVIKRGIALTPVKFGISFTATHFNQAGALVHVYTDGSVHLNHGGTEMGQGLNTKVAQVVAETFQIDLDHVKITATTTGKVPNTSATAASSGADLNGMAAQAAAETIRQRLMDFASDFYEVPEHQIEFLPNVVRIGNQRVAFAELVQEAYVARVQLSATGFYKTPKIHWDRDAGKGRPFFYFAYGASCSEVAIDTLTGEYHVERTDILHDCGHSLNPALDRGQIEGGFVQGMGWLTTEELWWDDKGRLRTHAPSTYKIPLASDRPKIFNVTLADWSKNREATVRRSKAVGEPPFMLAVSVFEAISHAVASVADYRECPRLDAPATPERVLMAVERLKASARETTENEASHVQS